MKPRVSVLRVHKMKEAELPYSPSGSVREETLHLTPIHQFVTLKILPPS
jgi:hypothetical protein